MSFALHGNYVGPGWSAGKYQNSVEDPSVPAIDAFDEAARLHDAAYSKAKTNRDRADADWEFVKNTKGLGTEAEIARSLVALQALGRNTYSYMFENNPKAGPKKAGKKNGPSRKGRNNKKKNQRPKTLRPQRMAPGRRIVDTQLANTNTTTRTYYTSTTRDQVCRSKGRELIGSVTFSSVNQIGNILFNQNIGPQYLSGTRLYLDSFRFERYKYRKCTLILKSKCSNSTNGSAIVFFERDVSEIPSVTENFNVQAAMSTYGGADVPCKMDGTAFMKKIPSENPYLTDAGASPDDPVYGQARAIVVCNAIGASVTSSSLTVWDIILDYDCDFYIPQLNSGVNEFGIVVNPTGANMTVSNILGNPVDQIKAGPIDVAKTSDMVYTFATRPGNYYQVIAAIGGVTIATVAFTNTGTTQPDSYAANASASANITNKVILATTNSIVITFTAGGVSSAFAGFLQTINLGKSNIFQPVPGPLAFSTTNKQIDEVMQRLQVLEQLQQHIQSDVFNQKEKESLSNSVIALEECKYCHDPCPDHFGRDCPMKPKNKSYTPKG